MMKKQENSYMNQGRGTGFKLQALSYHTVQDHEIHSCTVDYVFFRQFPMASNTSQSTFMTTLLKLLNSIASHTSMAKVTMSL